MVNNQLELQHYARALTIMFLPFDFIFDKQIDNSICNTVEVMRHRVLQGDYWEPLGGLEAQTQILGEYLSKCKWLDSQTGEEKIYQVPHELEKIFLLLQQVQINRDEVFDSSLLPELVETANKYVLPLLRLLAEGKIPVIEQSKSK